MKLYIYSFYLLLLFLWASCTSDEECRKNKNVNLISKFYHVTYIDSTATNKYTLLSIDSISIQGLRTDTLTNSFVLVDSIIYNNTKNVSTIRLPLNSYKLNKTTYQVRLNELTDTISIFHANHNYYISLECGCIKTFTIDTVLTTHNFIDSIKITNHTVKNTDAENLYIYN